MRVWVYVEGKSDKLGLDALWDGWKGRLNQAGWGIRIIPLDGKSKYFKVIGRRVAEKLQASETDLVVGLPDLYPTADYAHTEYRHESFSDLVKLQYELVAQCTSKSGTKRFLASALKHDLEMLLLAASQQLQQRLGNTQIRKELGLPKTRTRPRRPRSLSSNSFSARQSAHAERQWMHLQFCNRHVCAKSRHIRVRSHRPCSFSATRKPCRVRRRESCCIPSASKRIQHFSGHNSKSFICPLAVPELGGVF